MKINDSTIDLHVFKETEFLIEGLQFVDPNDKSDFQTHYQEILQRYELMTSEQRARQRKWIENLMMQREKEKRAECIGLSHAIPIFSFKLVT